MLAAPRRALARMLQSASGFVNPSRHAAMYKGARQDHWGGDWQMFQASMSQVLRSDLTMLVDRSRDLTMNNPTIARIPTLFSENISGKDGITYQAAVKFANDKYNERANKALEDSWYRWAEDPRNVSADRRHTWFDIETMLDQVEPTDGETFLRKLVGFKNDYRFALQVLDTDQIDRRYNEEASKGRNAIVMGVEVDEWGGAVAYHVWPNHPSEMSRRGARMRIPADDIIHNFLSLRPGQVRGIPWGAPGIIEAQHLGEYREAEVVAARVAAAKMGFVQPAKDSDGIPQKSLNKRLTWDATPGTIEQIDGEFKAWDPLHPNGNYESFDKVSNRHMAMMYRVSYMSLSGDLSQTSYASGRLGYLSERNVYQMLQQRKIVRTHRVVHRAWLPQALMAGQVNYPSFDAHALSASLWHPRSFPGIDVEKETNAADHQVSMGLDTLTRLAAEQGRDIVDIAKERARELEIFKSLGVPIALMSVPKSASEPAANNANAPQNSDDNTTDSSKGAAHLSLVGVA